MEAASTAHALEPELDHLKDPEENLCLLLEHASSAMLPVSWRCLRAPRMSMQAAIKIEQLQQL